VETASLDTVGLPPQVLNVIVSGSASLHDPFSLDTVDGSGSQIATVPVGGVETISIVFSEGVNVDANSLMVIGLTTATLPQVAEFSYDGATNTATWGMEGWALGDQYVLSLSDAITDLDGNNLDGEWTNPASITTVNSAVSTFSSGDGLSVACCYKRVLRQSLDPKLEKRGCAGCSSLPTALTKILSASNCVR